MSTMRFASLPTPAATPPYTGRRITRVTKRAGEPKDKPRPGRCMVPRSCLMQAQERNRRVVYAEASTLPLVHDLVRPIPGRLHARDELAEGAVVSGVLAPGMLVERRLALIIIPQQRDAHPSVRGLYFIFMSRFSFILSI